MNIKYHGKIIKSTAIKTNDKGNDKREVRVERERSREIPREKNRNMMNLL